MNAELSQVRKLKDEFGQLAYLKDYDNQMKELRNELNTQQLQINELSIQAKEFIFEWKKQESQMEDRIIKMKETANHLSIVNETVN